MRISLLFFYRVITLSIRSRITSKRAPMLRSPVKILGQKLFVITSRRPRTIERAVSRETAFPFGKRTNAGSRVINGFQLRDAHEEGVFLTLEPEEGRA